MPFPIQCQFVYNSSQHNIVGGFDSHDIQGKETSYMYSVCEVGTCKVTSSILCDIHYRMQPPLGHISYTCLAVFVHPSCKDWEERISPT